MKPLFTIHAGEYLVGSHVEREFNRRINVWVPSTDTGIDLLLSNRDSTRTASVQVSSPRISYPLRRIRYCGNQTAL